MSSLHLAGLVANMLDGVSIDAVVGSQGIDAIGLPAATGGAGLYIIGGSGNDAMTASGNDVVLLGVSTSGIAQIMSFATGDKLDVRPTGLIFATLHSDANLILDDAVNAVAVAGGNLTITLSRGNTVALQGVASLVATDFVV